jgi:hypothetical protein
VIWEAHLKKRKKSDMGSSPEEKTKMTDKGEKKKRKKNKH